MFIGTSEKLKKKIENFNANSNYFIFSKGDLELDYNEISGKRHSIVSATLRTKLGEIIAQQKKPEDNINSFPTIIEIEKPRSRIRLSPGPWSFYWWLIVKKKHIYEQAASSGGNTIALKLENKNTVGNQKKNWDDYTTESLGYIFGDGSYLHSSEWKEICQSEKEAVEQKRDNLRNIANAARTEIKNKIKEANMELAEVLAGEEYFDLQPQYCFCGDSPAGQEEYYSDHLIFCLGREERVNEFKNQVIKIVERNVGKFNQRRKEIIEKAKQEAQNKGVELEFDFWEESVHQCRNSEQLSDFEKRINNLVQNLANIGEELRKEQEKIARETAQEKQEQAKRKKEEQEEKEKNREQKARQRKEKLEKEQEEKEKEEKEKFEFKENQDFGLSREKEELNKKIADLQQRLRDWENQGDTYKPIHEKERRDLEKELWDLRMDNLAKIPPPSDRNDRHNPTKRPDDPTKDKNSSRVLETKKSNFNLGGFFLFGVFLVIGGIIIIALVIKKKRKN